VKRIPQSEVLDDTSLSHDAAVESLSDLRRVNRWFGGVRTTTYLLRRAMQKSGLRSASVLEVAAGDGYSITHAAKRLKHEGLDVNPVCLDRRELNQQIQCCSRTMVGDALNLPFAPASFDFVSCGLFLHHLAPEQVIAFVNGALAVARRAVLINDLRRSPFHLALVYAGTLLMRSPVSRYDGVASVRQAYTPQELRQLLGQTNAASAEIQRRYLFRMGAIVWK
jgi:2-polyprenyl-3-methyl-5-hydroxy-6-metoxy-1,4-benzoquinol methylase